MTSVDFGAFRPVTAIRRTGEAAFATDAGELAVSAIAPGVLRLRLGPHAKPDYGLLAMPLASHPGTLREIEGVGEATCAKYGAAILALIPKELNSPTEAPPS